MGALMNKRLRNRSQYYPDHYELPVSVEHHSQLGGGYGLAQLGVMDEVFDRLAKYDLVDQPLKRNIAADSINYFLDKIHPCSLIEFDGALESMDLTKSIGFGAQKKKIFSRQDPAMLEYLRDYVEKSKLQTYHIIVNGAQKDEIRVDGKTPRLFCSFPPEHTFLATIVLGDFVDQFLSHRFCLDGSISTIGDSVQTGAAQHYYEELSKRPYAYCTDTSAQDSSVTTEFINMVYDAIKMKYELDEESSNLFEAVRFNSINKLMNVNGHVFLVNRGLGSGDYLTTIINIMWRYYMFLENYNHKYEDVLLDNTIIICGDDFACSSEHPDLNLNSSYAKIEWAGKPITWEEMDFCSLHFRPYVHHDPIKVEAVLNLRKKKLHQLSPVHEMQRLGGLLRVLSNERIYNLIVSKMSKLVSDYPETRKAYRDLYISYEDLYLCYNSYIQYH